MPFFSCIVVLPPNICFSYIIILYCFPMIYSYIYFTTINTGVNKIDVFSHFKHNGIALSSAAFLICF